MPASSPEAISELLRLLYQAAAEPSRWPDFLQQLIQEVGAERVALLQHQLKPGMIERSRQSTQLFQIGYSPEAVCLYNNQYGTDDPYARGFRQRQLNLRVGLCGDLVDHAALRRTAFYHEYARRFGAFYLCWIAFTDARRHIALSLVRSEKRSSFGENELELLTLLTPHVEQALSLQRKLEQFAGEAAAAKRTVEVFTLAVVTLDNGGSVTALSPRAEALLQQESGIRLKDRRIVLDDTRTQARLRSLVDGALLTARGRGLEHPVLAREPQGAGKIALEVPTPPSGGAVLVWRDKEPSPLQVFVSPFHSDSVLQADQPSAVLFLSEPASLAGGHEKWLRELYGLTAAEARLATLIGAAVPLPAAAERLHITISTARDRLKQIFRKTETARQAELVRLLSRWPDLER